MTTSLALPISGSAPAQELAVKIRNLNYFYGQGELRKQVLFDINLDLPKGQIVIMTGPSGSGKTTLLSLIGALRTVQDGSLNVLGQEVVGLHDADLVKFRRNIGSHSSRTQPSDRLQTQISIRWPKPTSRDRAGISKSTCANFSRRTDGGIG
jgi:ABC-type multidrug transport system ATPase subunit